MKRNLFLSVIALMLSTSFATAQPDSDRYAKKMLLEEFTTEHCSNCPAVTTLITQMIFKDPYKEDVIVVAHHSGFGTDFLTTEADTSLLWFYNSYNIYCPALMFDRFPNFYSGKRTPVGLPQNLAEIEKYTDRRLSKKSRVGFDISADYNGDNSLVVTVTGERSEEFSSNPSRIFVYITENRIPAEHQQGASNGYKHRHALRQYNSIAGDEITWNGDNFCYECTMNIGEEWNQKEMEIIAFVSAYDETDPTQCVVENVRSIPFSSSTNGIDDLSLEKSNTNIVYYTMDGLITNVPDKGMYIQKKTLSDGTVETRKIHM